MTTADIIPDYENLPLAPGYRSFLPKIGPLMCDLYALTMTQAAHTLGFAETKHSTSNVFCRSLVSNGQMFKDTKGEMQPVKVPYLVNAGLGLIAEWMDGWKFENDDLRYLANIRLPSPDGGKGQRLFNDKFLFWLSKQRLTLDIDAMPEGELVFPQEPALRIHGLWWQQQMVEGAILSLVSSSTNQTTLALQVRLAAQRHAAKEGATLIEASTLDVEQAGLADMSLRRSLSIGALQSGRAAAIAGWNSSSNVYFGKCYDFPVMGTFAHSWVMLHDTEEEAFENWAKTNPGLTIYLPDTYSTIEGIKTAIRICKKHDLNLKGIRLDSGDMEHFSQMAHKLLKEAGFNTTLILGTDGLDLRAAYNLYGNALREVTKRTSYIDFMGIGSENAVNRYQPLLNEVMKLAAVYDDPKALAREVLKLSETKEKTTLPGEIDVIRYLRPTPEGLKFAGDTIVPKNLDLGDGTLSHEVISVHAESGMKKPFLEGTSFYRPLQPWMRDGQMVQDAFSKKDPGAILKLAIRQCAESVLRLDADHLRFEMPHRYGWGIEESLLNKRNAIADSHHMATARAAQRDRFQLNAA